MNYIIIIWFSVPLIAWFTFSCVIHRKKLIQVIGVLVAIALSIGVIAYLDVCEKIVGTIFIRGAKYALSASDFDGNVFWKYKLVFYSDPYGTLKGLLLHYSFIVLAVVVPAATWWLCNSQRDGHFLRSLDDKGNGWEFSLFRFLVIGKWGKRYYFSIMGWHWPKIKEVHLK